MSAPRKIHIASKTYQRNWAVGERTFCTDVGAAEGLMRNIDQVGYRPHWWGRHPGLAEEIEQRTGEIESRATPFLRDPGAHWPLSGNPRARLAVFIALHVTRSPGWRHWHEGIVYQR